VVRFVKGFRRFGKMRQRGLGNSVAIDFRWRPGKMKLIPTARPSRVSSRRSWWASWVKDHGREIEQNADSVYTPPQPLSQVSASFLMIVSSAQYPVAFDSRTDSVGLLGYAVRHH